MKETLTTIITNLVDKTDEIVINEAATEKSIIFEVKVADTDMGRIIGREGRISQAIRTLMKALAAKEGKKVTVEFID